MSWSERPHWAKILERRVHEALALAKGIGPAHADRIADVCEQIDELRQEVAQLREQVEQLQDAMDKAREAYRKLKNGGSHE